MGDAGAVAAEDERRADDRREADVVADGDGLVHRVGEPRRRHGQPDPGHRLLEQLAVLGRADRLRTRADQLHAVGVEHAVVDEGHRQVQRGLATEGREKGVGPLALDHRGDDLGLEGFDVGAVGELGVGHDRRRVGVGEDDLVALGPQDPARLGARVVELAGLADDDRAAADDQDRLDVGALRH